MKIIEKTETKLSIQAELKQNRILGLLFSFVVFIFFALVLPLRFPLISTLSCDRINPSEINCQLQEVFTVGFKVKKSLHNVLTATQKVAGLNLYYVQLKLKPKKSFLNFINIQKLTIGFPTNQGFIILSQKQGIAIVRKINDFIADSTDRTLTIEKNSDVLPVLTWSIVVAIALFVTLSFLFWPFKTYTFDREQQNLILTQKIKFIRTKQIKHSFHEIEKIEWVRGIKHPEDFSSGGYIIAVSLHSSDRIYYLGDAENLISANQIVQLITYYIKSK
ncbi:MAG: hypothetical protein J7647_28170 [Cyanobacteria bacterium SBLK]|nr:hypothetical protein [Cyanobacteria bacterium SBLK]